MLRVLTYDVTDKELFGRAGSGAPVISRPAFGSQQLTDNNKDVTWPTCHWPSCCNSTKAWPTYEVYSALALLREGALRQTGTVMCWEQSVISCYDFKGQSGRLAKSSRICPRVYFWILFACWKQRSCRVGAESALLPLKTLLASSNAAAPSHNPFSTGCTQDYSYWNIFKPMPLPEWLWWRS